jgi:hypothetical protein
MRADRIHIAVRPRGILECLDLAVMFCGRRPAAVALATALGALPCILLNRLLFANARDAEPAFFVAYLLLGLEAAWASVPLTLYLGQAVFSARFSWRLAARALLPSLPALLVFQGILRGICLLIVFLGPVVFIGMYYLNQVILLERPRFGRIWSRRGAMNQRNAGHVMSLALIDAAILLVGVPLGTRFLGAVAALWQGRPVSWLPARDGADGLLGAAVFSWHGQIAFWSVCGLLTVFRFFTYLDARIRREGWDVELKLRSDATYAGLAEARDRESRPAVQRRLVNVAGTLVAFAVVIAGTATAAEATVEAGDGARRALTRQSYPWYDAAEDRYRPLIHRASEGGSSTESLPSSSARGGRGDRGGGGAGRGGGSGRESGSGSGRESGSGSGRESGSLRPPPPPPAISLPMLDLGNLGWILMVALFVAALLAVIYLLVRFGLGKRDDPEVETGADAAAAGCDEERLTALPDGARLAGSDLLARAAAHAERGEFERAVVFFHAWLLLTLDRRGSLALARGKTNGQYTAEVAAASPALAPLFRRSSRLFEDAFFGALPVSRADFLAVWDERDRIAAAGRTTGD